jgi:hypothetical protein
MGQTLELACPASMGRLRRGSSATVPADATRETGLRSRRLAARTRNALIALFVQRADMDRTRGSFGHDLWPMSALRYSDIQQELYYSTLARGPVRGPVTIRSCTLLGVHAVVTADVPDYTTDIGVSENTPVEHSHREVSTPTASPYAF